MKKTYYLMLFVLILSTSAKAQTGWVTKNLDEKMSIKFPAEPQKVIRKGTDIYVAKGKDSVGYVATVIDYNLVADLDSATLAPMKDSQEFADQMRTGMMSTMIGYTLGDVTIGKWKTYTTYSMSGSKDNDKSKLSIHMILIGSKMYTFSCLVPVNIVTQNDQVFFSSADTFKK